MERSPQRNGGRGDRSDQQKGRERAMSLPAALHYNQEIARYSKQKQYDLACQSFERMLNAGVPPDVVTYNTMINVYVKSQRLSDAFSLFDEMKRTRIDPTIVTYTSLIDGCGKCNSFGHAMMLYEDVKTLGIQLNMHFFNAILNAGLLNGNVYIIDTVLADVARSNLKPNTVTFNTLLAGFSRFDQLPRMKDVVEHMIREGVEFSPVTQTTLLQAAQLVRDQNDLRMFLELLEAAKFLPSKNQASQAVMDLINAKRLFVAHQLMSTFLSRNCSITEEVFGAMCRLSGEFGNFLVLQWVTETARAIGINIDSDAFIAKMNIHAKFGDYMSAKEMYDKWGINHIMIPGEVKLSLVDNLLSAGDVKSALQITDHLIQDGQLTAPTDTGKLLKFLSQRELYSDVLRVFDILKQMLIPTDSVGADCVIAAALKSPLTEDRIDSICDLHPAAHSILHLIQALSPPLINRITWDRMIRGNHFLPHPGEVEDLMAALISNGFYLQAWNTFTHFVKCGIEATASLISLALMSQKDKRNHEDLMLILNTARESEVIIDTELASSVLLSAIESGNLADALAIHDEMVAARIQFSQEAEDLFRKHFNTVRFAFTDPKPSVDLQTRSSRTRRRSSTCPRMHLTPPEDSGFFAPQFFADDNL